MIRIRPIASLSALVGVAAFAVILSACTPTPSSGSIQATQTTAPDLDGTALTTFAAGTATAASGNQVQPTPVLAESPVDASLVSPIEATFFPERQATEYVVKMPSPIDEGSWASTSCGETRVESGGLKMTWVHAHPPCDETTGHEDQPISFYVRVPTHEGVRGILCSYQGASPGIGESCRWDSLR